MIATPRIIGTFTSFLTGITEPIEFTLLFLAPGLFVIHCILTGMSLAITYFLGMIHGYSFSAGLIDYLLNFNLAENLIGLLGVWVVEGIIYFIIFYFCIIKFNLRTPRREEDSENIEDVDSCITRVRLKLNDGSKIDKLKLKRVGVTEIIRLGSNNVQIMIETMADPIISRMRKSIKE